MAQINFDALGDYDSSKIPVKPSPDPVKTPVLNTPVWHDVRIPDSPVRAAMLRRVSRQLFGNWLILWLGAGFAGGGIGAFCGAMITPVVSDFAGIFHAALGNVIPAMFAFCFSGVLQGLALMRLDSDFKTTAVPWCLAHCSISFGFIVFILALGSLSPAPGNNIFSIINTFLANPTFGSPLAASLGSACIGFLITQDPHRFGMGPDGTMVGIIYGTTTFFGWLLGWGLAKDILSSTESFEQLTASPLLFGVSMGISGAVAIVFFGAITIYFRSR